MSLMQPQQQPVHAGQGTITPGIMSPTDLLCAHGSCMEKLPMEAKPSLDACMYEAVSALTAQMQGLPGPAINKSVHKMATIMGAFLTKKKG
jgi:hypothetical protein